ncbi:MAG: hypothetical protein K2P68_09035, partial [Sphingomonas sp.]|nr:hypothetical protein [Sphingomonas sp.]
MAVGDLVEAVGEASEVGIGADAVVAGSGVAVVCAINAGAPITNRQIVMRFIYSPPRPAREPPGPQMADHLIHHPDFAQDKLVMRPIASDVGAPRRRP